MLKHIPAYLIILAAFLSQPAKALDTELSGKVIGVTDGDTITLLIQKNPTTIRLSKVDCPEKTQEYGTQVKEITSDLVFGKQITVRQPKLESYGRYIGDVYRADGLNVSEELVKRGWCWWYRKYAQNEPKLEALEQAARQSRIGIWQSENPIPPWNFRRGFYAPQGASSIPSQIKLSKTGICHAPGSLYYYKVKTSKLLRLLKTVLKQAGENQGTKARMSRNLTEGPLNH